MDIVAELKAKPFSCRTFLEKHEIIKTGRPTPTIKENRGGRNFQVKWYSDMDWLCASSTDNNLYCWPCLLFKPKKGQSWTDSGFSRYRNVTSADTKKHASSTEHLSNYKKMKVFGKTNIANDIDTSARMDKERHNKIVQANRDYLKQLMIAVLYLSKQELAFRGHREDQESSNKGNYRELLDSFSKLNVSFKERFNSAEGNFTGVSSSIQNDLIEATADVISNRIREEVNNAKFVSVQADETTDCAQHAQLSIIVRYVHDNKLCERFLGFYDVSESKSAETLSQKIIQALDQFNDIKQKLVCQTYDGAAVMAGHVNGVQMKLRENGFEHANFIHCYAHKLNLVLGRSTERIQGVRIFFSHVNAFSRFSHSSSKRKELFRKFHISIPSLCETRWCYRSRTISAIKDQHKNIVLALSSILESPGSWDDDTIHQAEHLLSKLYDFKFIFLVNCFNIILSRARKLYDVLQCRQLDMKYGMEKVNEFTEIMQGFRNEEHFNEIVAESNSTISNNYGAELFSRGFRSGRVDYKALYFQIFDNTLMALEERFSNCNQYIFFDVFDFKRFDSFSKNFPSYLLNSLNDMYPNLFDIKTLTTELKFVYTDADFKKCSTLKEVLDLVFELDLISAFPQIVLLLQFLLTFPLTSVSTERSFSTLNRVRTFLRSTMSQSRLSSLAKISIEKIILKELEEKEELYDLILQEFLKKKRRLEFTFR